MAPRPPASLPELWLWAGICICMSVFCCIAVCVLVVLVGEEGCLHVRNILLFACGKNVFGIHVGVLCLLVLSIVEGCCWSAYVALLLDQSSLALAYNVYC